MTRCAPALVAAMSLAGIVAVACSLGCDSRKGSVEPPEPEPTTGPASSLPRAASAKPPPSASASPEVATPAEGEGAERRTSPPEGGPTPGAHPEGVGSPSPSADDGPACRAIYTVTTSSAFYAFYPRERRFERVGVLSCPTQSAATPFSMAVSRAGFAHVLYTDGRIYAVDVTNASCEETAFGPHPSGEFAAFGMSYARVDGAETLFVASRPRGGTSRLARVSVEHGTLRPLGQMGLAVQESSLVELTATRQGLWGFSTDSSASAAGTLFEIDTTTATIGQRVPLPVGKDATALALAWWGESFYVFTSTAGAVVTRFDPRTRRSESVARLADRIVGAGAATCLSSV